jgi:hypothetical protein
MGLLQVRLFGIFSVAIDRSSVRTALFLRHKLAP